MNNQILIVDDHPAVRMTVRHLLESEGCSIIGETDNGSDALLLIRELRPDTLVLDIGLPHVDGLTIIDHLATQRSPIKIIVLTAQESNHIAIRCMQAGAHGFVNKHQDLCELIHAIRAVNDGLGYFAQQVLPRTYIDLLQERQEAQFKTLSNRELDVLQQLAQGLSNKQIAERMSLSAKTISACRVRLLIKLNARTLGDLYEVASYNGLLKQ
ncbi:DNA-binding response regulator [Pseudomonas atacamensis]|uniref:DNA-binding response regulator n=1 Tax=Pseudomonas atacamensis TaxID=2565368 RepID=A0ABQ5PD07_9PSED|nr:response regulator transcription factor [Pseudomonas atacamensis]GLH41381.1 DNA-binding response regulator [Pseudomonas atacamensis]GLH52124.1 DNA-binding response regulator [Pseudomonas atacamensis]